MATKNVKTKGTGAHGGKSRYMTRAEAKEGARVGRRAEDKVAAQDEEEDGVLVCPRCLRPAVVDLGDGSGLFSSECIEKRCKRKR